MTGPALHADLVPQGQTRWSTPLSSPGPNPALLSALARAILAGEPTPQAIAARCAQTLGRSHPWLVPLATRFLQSVADLPRPRHREVIHFLRTDRPFQKILTRHTKPFEVERWPLEPQPMQPIAAARGWNLPPLETVADLATWLNLEPSDLAWFADLKRLNARDPAQPRLDHYLYRILSKPFSQLRLIEIPKPRLKQIQRQILTHILDPIPLHPAAHGFRKGRSVKTFAAPHTGRRVVLRMDLQDFFPTLSGPRIQAFFRTAGYPEPVADLLGGLCTNATPRSAWRNPGIATSPAALREARRLYARPHLPQGAPTSPALANLCAFRIDSRLLGLAQSAHATYTRYADDLLFSGDEPFLRHIDRFSSHAAAILLEEGFTPNYRKTRIMRHSVRQHAAGLILNQRLTPRRADLERLEAILTNCIRHGPETQNRESHPDFRGHLTGRVSFVESIHAEKGAPLRTLLNQVVWPFNP